MITIYAWGLRPLLWSIAACSFLAWAELPAAELPFAPPAEYTCDMETTDSHFGNGKLSIGKPGIRIDYTDRARARALLVFRDMTTISRVLRIPEKTAEHIIGKPSAIVDPSLDPAATWTRQGAESIAGDMCDRYTVVSTAFGLNYTAWVDAKHAVVRRIIRDNHTSYNFTNLKIGPLQAGLFDTPTDFKVLNPHAGEPDKTADQPLPSEHPHPSAHDLEIMANELATAGVDRSDRQAYQEAMRRKIAEWYQKRNLPVGDTTMRHDDGPAPAMPTPAELEAAAATIRRLDASIPQAVTRPAWAEAAGKDEHGYWATVKIGASIQKMRLIPAGTFTMGEVPFKTVHEVTLTQPFWLADATVTQGQWQELMGANPSIYAKSPDHPVEQIAWPDCQAFLKVVNERVKGFDATLPTEAQWEYACRAGTTGSYAGNLDALGWCLVDNIGKGTHPVRQKQANGWGLYDMYGNVWQWCSDVYLPHFGVETAVIPPAQDPTGPEVAAGTMNVSHALRGGCWASPPKQAVSWMRIRGKDSGSHVSSRGMRICAPAQTEPANAKF